jgi:hypothetical protein
MPHCFLKYANLLFLAKFGKKLNLTEHDCIFYKIAMTFEIQFFTSFRMSIHTPGFPWMRSHHVLRDVKSWILYTVSYLFRLPGSPAMLDHFLWSRARFWLLAARCSAICTELSRVCRTGSQTMSWIVQPTCQSELYCLVAAVTRWLRPEFLSEFLVFYLPEFLLVCVNKNLCKNFIWASEVNKNSNKGKILKY